VTLTGEEEARLARVPTENTEAYTAYLIGRDRLRDRKVEGLEEAIEQFAKAIELDPQFAGAYSGLADACHLYEVWSSGPRHERCPAGPEALLQLAQKAVELDENLGEAWISLGAALQSVAAGSRSETIAKLEEARAAYERGLSLNPNNIQGYFWYAGLLHDPDYYDDWYGWMEAAKGDTWQSIIKRGLEVDPLSILLHLFLSNYAMEVGAKEEAWFQTRRVIEIAPDSPRGYSRLSLLSWMYSFRIDESIRQANEAAEIDPRNPNYAMQIALGYATLGDIDMAMAYWERAGQLIAEDVSPVLDILHALILLSDKDSIPMQQVFDALQPIDAGNNGRGGLIGGPFNHRMEIEANLAMINGDAKEWLASHVEYLSECLNTAIDDAYVDKWPECATWLDGLLLAAGEETRARAAAEKRIEWEQVWNEVTGYTSIDPRVFVIIGEEDKALDEFEKFLAEFRGNPAANRLWLAENLGFILYHDPILSPIRDHPRFQAVVAEVEADLAQQLENVREMENDGEIPTLEEVKALNASKQDRG